MSATPWQASVCSVVRKLCLCMCCRMGLPCCGRTLCLHPLPAHPTSTPAEPGPAAYDPNDGNQWGPRSGQDFRANHAHPSIDYAVMHLWPDK